MAVYVMNTTNVSAAGKSHQGSTYGLVKDVRMSTHREEHIKFRLSELEELTRQHQEENRKLGTLPQPQTVGHPITNGSASSQATHLQRALTAGQAQSGT